MRIWKWDSPQVDSAIDEAAHARLYLDMIAESDYAEKIAPGVGMTTGSVLDIGAGAGDITRRCLAGPARWIAVEPNPEMRRVLASLQAPLEIKSIQLEILPLQWQSLPSEVVADTAFAFNVGATHHQADALFEAMLGRQIKTMVWVVPAQNAPSSFCLAGYLPPEIHGESERPAYLNTLAQLGSKRKPHDIEFVDWECRYTFSSKETLLSHFRERLAIQRGSNEARNLENHVLEKIETSGAGLQVCCSKRSAVMRWTFD